MDSKHAGDRRRTHRRDLLARQHAEGEHRHGDEQRRDDHEADHGRAADVLALQRVARVHARRLDADEHEHGDQHGLAHLRPDRAEGLLRLRAAPEVVVEDLPVEVEQQHHDEQQQRHDLGDGDDLVDAGRALHAPQDQEVEGPHQHRGDEHGRERVAVAEHREEGARAWT